jgi:gentisate 1,2-dioxygenase
MTLKMRDLPVQFNANPSTPSQDSARYYNSGTAFQLERKDVPPTTFEAEALAALSPDAMTGIINCDSSAELDLTCPATAPNVLARYATIRAAQSLIISANASTLVFYVIRGSGRSESHGDPIHWSEGDVFVLAGRQDIRLTASGTMNAVLWVVGDDPLMAFFDLTTKSKSSAGLSPVHYLAEDIERQLALIYSTDQELDTAGRAVIFSSKEYDAIRNIAPVLTLALNTLEPGEQTRPHRHNSVAVMLVLNGENCHSMAGNKVKPWIQHTTTVTPPFAWHTHHNDGDKLAKLLIVQDGGFYTHARVTGFSFG